MDQTPETVIAHVDQPAFEQMQIDQNISRVAIFFVCFLTLGVFYFTLVNFQVARLLPIQQIQQVQQVVSAINPAASRAPAAASDRPVGALGGSQIGASAVPSAAASASAPPASTAASAKPSAAASAQPIPSGGYSVEAGDTLTTIARKFNVSVQSIADANKMPANATLQVGQKITIPRG
ncbi:MAG: LysM peptidoglycan-binding domain-containing protein [Chloroflexi bacterium]|nr:LysM peptidoglycan-binding domain-containing protein [Chloroflexota bacterium]